MSEPEVVIPADLLDDIEAFLGGFVNNNIVKFDPGIPQILLRRIEEEACDAHDWATSSGYGNCEDCQPERPED